MYLKKIDLIKELEKTSLNNFNKNLNSLGIYLIRFNGEKGIIRCNHLDKDKVITLLKSIKKISSNEIEILTIGTSGTIKGLLSKHMNKLFFYN